MNWYLDIGENSDVVTSTRIRFARNISGYNFGGRINEEEFVITQVVESNDESLKAAIAEYQAHQSILTFAVALLIGICLALLAVVLWLCIRYKNRG